MDRAWNEAYEGRTDLDRDDELVTMGDNGVRYPNTLWMEDVAGASGMELRAEPDESELPDCARESLGQLNVFGVAA